MSHDLSSSSTSSSPTVFKTLIDFTEYQKLLALRSHLDKQERKLKEQLQTSVQVQEGKGEASTSALAEKEEPTPQNTETSEDKIVTAVIQRLEQLFGLVVPSTSQSGAGIIITMIKWPVFYYHYN